jgi:hypothetical protein
LAEPTALCRIPKRCATEIRPRTFILSAPLANLVADL